MMHDSNSSTQQAIEAAIRAMDSNYCEIMRQSQWSLLLANNFGILDTYGSRRLTPRGITAN